MLRSMVRAAALAVAAVVCVGPLVLRAQSVGSRAGVVDEVDPTIGNVSILLEPTRPTAYLPNSMVRMYPVRKDALDPEIQYFPLTILSHRQPELFAVMPGDGKPAAYDAEHATPYFYTSRFDDGMIGTEFAPAHQAGYFRFTFPDGKATLLVRNLHPGSVKLVDAKVVTGEEKVMGVTAYFYAETSAPVRAESAHVGDGDRVSLTASGAKSLDFRYGVSFISVEQAKRNLQREIPAFEFERVKDAARATWNAALGQIEVEGGTPAQRRVFYTALYRCMERMINITEDGRYYSGFDHQVHEDARPFYVDNWLWDTYRAMEPLQTLLNPDMQADKIQSYVRMYQQSGIMPTFALTSGPAAIMNGNHAAPWIADAWNKGVRNFDLPTAYAGLRKRSLEQTMLPWTLGPKTVLDDFYAAHGYMPALRPGEKETVPQVASFEKRQPVPVTLGNSTDDWCIAQLAGVLHKPEDRALFLKRAANYRNLYRADKGLMWPKDDQGNWIEPMDPKFGGGLGGREYYDENNGYTYAWDVPHDYAGLIALMGGRAKAEANLDQLFREPLGRSRYEFQAKFPDSTSMIGQFSMANEPSLNIPYLYDRMGAPWKTQARVRSILTAFFPDDLQGIPGDEDGGGLSSFVVWSMMGVYPVMPGVPVYDVASPVFTKVTVHLKSGKDFVIAAPASSADNEYVESVRWNGKAMDHLWITHKDVTSGGTLDLTMGSVPNRLLGSQEKAAPPDSMDVDVSQFE
ncbi:GH92 family glycosyl hydrolase [Terriglobus aquaticus]|uniref:GH92 family glycosyl hydrolase n=1 Tax=Terriglobus aquaticus TaxID=940139 RepID=A0ABW9KFH9_9BACT|nr:GH92 family glycosyl hydrolase [Terriglobus aquaticus]